METGLRPGTPKDLFISPVKLFIKLFIYASVILMGTTINVSAQTINNVSVTGAPVCAGSTLTVNFNVVNGSGAANHFTNATQYQAYLSNASGVGFAPTGAPFSITAVYPTTDGSSIGVQATITIPSTIPNGASYKIAIGSSSPVYNGSAGANASAAFTVNAPTVSILSNDSDNSICAGTSVTFTATPNNTTAPTYQWQLNNANIPGATGSTYTTSALSNADQIKVIMTSSNPCATFPTVTSNIIPMTVNAVVVPTVSISVNPGSTICPGTSVTFTSTVFNGGTAVYQWLLNGSPIASANASTYTTTTLTNGQIISLNVTSNAVCASPVSVTSAGITMTVNAATPVQPAAISGTATVCPAITGLTYSISAVANATSYTWSVPTGWSITSGQNSTSITVTSGSAGQNGNITVTATNSCGTSTAQTLAVTVSPATPVQPGAITGTAAVCPSLTGLVYSIAAVTNASSYTWSVPTGWSIAAGQNSTAITATSGTAGQNGNISVTATNSCGTSIVRTFAVTVNNPTPAQPGTITGTAVVCPAITGLTYSISAVTNASSYTWSVPTGWSITGGQNSTSLTVISGSAGQNGNITVTATNSCGTSTAQTLAVTVSPATPAQPAVITGTAAVCPSATGLGYSISAVTNATSYSWSVPAGWSITAGQNSTSLIATAGSAGQNGNITVTATNSCGTSTARTFAVTVNNATPAQPGIITGTVAVCPAMTGLVYNISAVTNATTYTWSVPTGWSITGGQNSTSLTVTSGAAGQNGDITVTATNSCGTSIAQTLAVTVSPATPAQPGAITGISAVCPLTSFAYSISTVTNASSYTWSVPSGWSITGGQNSTSLTVTSGTTGQNGNITITATNSCGTSTIRSLAVTVSPATPAQPGAITGSSSACINSTGLSYSIAGVTGASSYVWTLPSGWSITAGANSNSITVSTSAIALSGNITVSAANSCGTSSVQSFAVAVTIGVLPPPGIITGLSAICPAKTPTYSIAAVGGATSYTWTVPASWSITSGQGTTSIVANVPLGASSGTVSVVANNICGSSAASSLPVVISNTATVYAGPDQTVCYGTSSVNLAGETGGAINTNSEWDWDVSASGGTIVSPNSLTSQYNFPSGATTTGTLTVKIKSNISFVGCPFTEDVMLITILPTPAVTITSAGPVCNGSTSTVTFTGTPNTTVTYNTSQTINIGASGVATLTTGALTTNTTYTLNSIAYATAPVCNRTYTSTSTTITVNPLATVSAGSAFSICAGSAATMAGSFGGAATSATWTTTGTGTFSNNNPTAVYTPSAGDIAAGSVTLTYTSNDPAGPCNAVTASMVLTINPVSTVSAGLAQTICAGSTATMAGTFGGAATSATWTTSGTGTFNNNNSATAIYTPSVADVTAGAVTLTFTTNDPAGPCGSANASIVLTINPVATINAGPAFSICAGSTATMAGAFGGAATSATWTTSGTGTFNNNSTTAIYTPGAADVTAGSVTLTYTSNDPAGPCNPAIASMVLTINPVATVSAGIAQTICAGSTAIMAGSFGNAATLATWTTSGTGSFNNNTTTAVYTPSAADVTAGTVTLTYTTNDPVGPCGSVNASMVLTINPVATVNAGPAFSICAGSTATMAGSFGGAATSATWTTSGTGTFNNNTATAVYTPSAADVTVGSVTLTYTTNDPSGPCNPATASMVLTINQMATVSAGSTQIICAGSTATMAGSFGGAATSATWTTSGTGSFNNNSTAAIYTPSAADVAAGTVTLTYTSNDPAGPCGAVNASIVLTINSIATVSAGTAQTICSNSTATMNGSFGGAATSATWTTSGDGTLSNNTPTAIYTPGTSDISNGTVNLTYTTADPAGPCNAVSSNVILTIKKAVQITTQPANTSVCASSNASMSVVAIGDQLTYQWYKGVPSTGTIISGATSATINFTNVTLADDGSYYVVITGISPCASVTSVVRTLNVDQSITITNQPVAQTVCLGTSVTFSVTANANGEALSYQWRKGGTNITSANSSSYTIATTSASDAGNYDVVIMGPAGYNCPSVTSSAVALTITPVSIGGTITGATNVCSPTNNTVLTLTGNVGSIVRWESSTDNFATAGTAIANTTNTLTAVNLTVTTSYRAVAKNGVCVEANGTSFTITVNPTPVANAIANQTLCNTSPSAAITFTSATAGTAFSWTNNTTSIGLAASGTGNIPSFTATNATGSAVTATITVTPSYTSGGATCTGTPITFTIVVLPSPLVNAISNQTVCTGASTGVVTFTGTATSYNWVNSNTATGLAASGTGNIASFTGTNTGTTAITSNITVTPTFVNGSVTCTGTPVSFAITVNPTPTVNAVGNQTVCNGAAVTAIAFGGTVAGTVYNWTNTTTSIGLAASGTGNIVSFNAINATASVVTSSITVTPVYTNGGTTCSGTPVTFTISVNPSPIVNAITNQTICNGAPITAVNFAGTATSYSWTNNTSSIGLAASGTGNISSFNGVNSGSSPIIATINVTPIYTTGSVTCTGTQASFTITVNPTPTVNVISDQTLCSGTATAAVTFGGAVTGTVYNWTNNTTSIGLAASGTGNIASFSAVNAGSAPVTATITVTPTYTNNSTTCTGTPRTFTINVNPVPTVNAISNQTVCNGAPVSAVNFGSTVTGTTYNWSSNNTSIGIAATGLGNMSSFNAVNTGSTPVTATITVTPSLTSGSVTCTGPVRTFTITVNPTPVVTTLSLDSACNASSPNVNLTSNVTSTFTWTVGTINGGITGATNGNGSTINQVLTNPSATVVGSVAYIVTPTSTVGSCAGLPVTITVNVYPPTIGGTLTLNGVPSPSNATLVCPSPPSSVTGGITLQNDKVGTILNWQSSTNGGANWTNFANTTSTFTYSGLLATTSYRSVLKSGSCDTAYSSIVVVSVVPAAPPSPVAASPTTICAGDTSVLSASVGFGTVGIPASGGNFNQGNPAGWCVDNQCSGNALPASGNNQNNAPFNETNGPKTFAGVVYDTYDNTKFAISGGTFSNPAPMGANTSWMVTPAFNLLGLPSANLNFYHAYNLTAGASISIDVSTDGGATFNPLQLVNGPAQLGINNATTPLPTGSLQPVNVSLNAYLGLTNIKIRFRFVSNAGSSWAIDGVSVPSNGMPASFVWTQTTPGPVTLIPVTGGNGTTIYASPAATTTYQIMTSVAGCPGGMQNVTVTVNPSPTITPGLATPVCASPTAQTATLAYSGVTANPTAYSISWNNTPANNFANVLNAPIGASATGSLSIPVPAGTAPGTYTGWIKVRNGNSCRSDSSSFTLTVNPRPTASVAGTTIICQGQSASFSIPVTGSGTFSGTLSNGVSFNNITSSPIPIVVSPTTTTTYTWGTLTNGTCAALASGLSGSHTVTVNVPVSITAQPQTQPVCLHYPSPIKTTATGTTPSYVWEVNNGTGWAPVVNGPDYSGATTDSLTVINPRIEMLGYQYRNNVNGAGPCNVPAVSVVANLKIRNVWLGTVDNNWQNGANWSDGVPPSVICDTVHILDRTLQPTLNSLTSTITNLLIYPGADMILGNQPNTYLEVAASIVNNNTVPGINALDGRLVLNGTVQPQTIKGSLFTQHILNYLTISNTTAGGASLNGVALDTLYISNHLNFGIVSGKTFNSNDRLTLMSRASRTASVGDLTNNGLSNPINVINGKVTVERWISQRKAWRFLAVPTSGPQTFRSAWQEKMLTPNDNRFPGYGTTITIGTPGNYVANGFDFYDLTGPSVKTYVPATNDYVGISNSGNDMTSSRGYMTFIRGNRSSTTFTSPVTSTILRTSGPLIQGTRPPVSVGGLFNDVANPYASPIDMRKINKPGAQEFYYLWNPNMSGGFGLGAFQTYSLDNGDFTPVPDDGSMPINFIQSGQAFFVAGFGTAGTGTVNIEESDKEFQSNAIFRTQGLPERVIANLSIVNTNNNSKTLVDGMRVDYGNDRSNSVDMYDARKLTNLNENVASLRESKFLSIERRKTIVETDTIFVNISGMRLQNYQWTIALSNMDSVGRTAFLIDKYLNTKTALALDDTTFYNFNVQNIAGSYAQGRFMIVFKQLPPPVPPAPVLISHISASRNYDNSIAIDWKVENERNVQGYTIERSANGNAFTGILTKDVSLNNGSTVHYDANDLSPLSEDNFYRIRALLQNGQLVYSQIVKVDPLPYDVGITLFPNPVKNKTLHIKFAGQVKGQYAVTLNNNLGQVVHQSTAVVNNNITSIDIKLNNYVASGTYQLHIISPSGEVIKQQVFIE